MTPYRSGREEKPTAAARPGLVTDMVRQFADPYAFLRELVQNGIDAGASGLDVAVERWPGGLVTTQVTDDGCGMTPEIIETQLLTLFSSSKEGDPTKIGKYGVGFISVFALDPEQVTVDTWRDGKAWSVRLHPDHSYEVSEAAPRAGSGTVVSVARRVADEEVAGHVERARASLSRWCRHAERPIRFSFADHEHPAAPTVSRIDAPLEVRSAFSVTTTIEDEVFVVGPVAGSRWLGDPPAEGADADHLERGVSFAGFYNRGLTLFETDVEVFEGLAGLRFKIVSPHLKHTLSRDNVRRDAAFGRALDHVRELAGAPLRAELAAALADAARAAAEGERVEDYAAILEAALAPPMSLGPKEVSFPLTDPIGGARALSDLRARTAGREPPLLGREPDAITAELARIGRPVVREVDPVVAWALRRSFPSVIVEEARSAFLLVREVELVEADVALCAEVGRALEAAGEGVARVALCTLEGSKEGRTAVAIPDAPPGTPRLCSTRDVEARWRRWGGGDRLLLNTGNDAVQAARAAPATGRRAAAHLLARALLVEAHGPLDARASTRLLELYAEPLA